MFINDNDFMVDELETARRIQRLRLNILVHSHIYYLLDSNIISDRDFDDMAKELVKLQQEYKDIASRVCFHEDFKDFDGTTGAFLPLENSWVVRKANQLLPPTLKSESEEINKTEVTHEYKGIQQKTGGTSCKGTKRKKTAEQWSNPLF